MYIVKNRLCFDPAGSAPATYLDLLDFVSVEVHRNCFFKHRIFKRQSGYVSRKYRSYGETPVFYAPRKHMLYTL